MLEMNVIFTVPIKTWLPGSALIRWTEKTKFSHASLSWFSESLNRSMIYQATMGGVNFQGGERFFGHQHLVNMFAVKVTDEQKTKIMQDCIDLSGTHYDYAGIIAVAIMKMIEWATGKKAGLPYSDGKASSFCSEALGYVFVRNIPELMGLYKEQDERLTTGALYKLMEKASGLHPEIVTKLK